MEKKLLIEILRKLPFDELSAKLGDTSEKADSGSAACVVASVAAALLKRASYMVPTTDGTVGGRLDYIRRNAEIIRDYMDHLIDEDVRCRGPIRKAFEDGSPDKITACCQPACAIAFETADMMRTLLGFCDELSGYFPEEVPHYVYEAASLACSAAESAIAYIDSVTRLSYDSTYSFITNKETGIYREDCVRLKEKVYSGYYALGAYGGKK